VLLLVLIVYFFYSSPLVRDPSASKSIFAESPALQDKTGDESAIFLAPSQPVSSFNFQHGSGVSFSFLVVLFLSSSTKILSDFLVGRQSQSQGIFWNSRVATV